MVPVSVIVTTLKYFSSDYSSRQHSSPQGRLPMGHEQFVTRRTAKPLSQPFRRHRCCELAVIPLDHCCRVAHLLAERVDVHPTSQHCQSGVGVPQRIQRSGPPLRTLLQTAAVERVVLKPPHWGSNVLVLAPALDDSQF